MKTIILFTLTVTALDVFAADAGNDESNFVSIFDGKSMTGWVGNLDGYEAKDGILSCLQERVKAVTSFTKRSTITSFYVLNSN